MTTAILTEDLENGEAVFKPMIANPRVTEEVEPEFLYSSYASVLMHVGYFKEVYDLLEDYIKLPCTSFGQIVKFSTLNGH